MTYKNTNVNELQAKLSKVVADVQDGDVYEISRYSKPIAVLLSYEDYLKLRGDCHRCVQDLRKIAKEMK